MDPTDSKHDDTKKQQDESQIGVGGNEEVFKAVAGAGDAETSGVGARRLARPRRPRPRSLIHIDTSQVNPTAPPSPRPRRASISDVRGRRGSDTSVHSDHTNPNPYDLPESYDPWHGGRREWTKEHFDWLVVTLSEALTDPEHYGLLNDIDPHGYLQKAIQESTQGAAQGAWVELLRRLDSLLKARINNVIILGQANQLLAKERTQNQMDQTIIARLREESEQMNRHILYLEADYSKTRFKLESQVDALRGQLSTRRHGDIERTIWREQYYAGSRASGGSQKFDDSTAGMVYDAAEKIQREYDQKLAKEKVAWEAEKAALESRVEGLEVIRKSLQREFERLLEENRIIHRAVEDVKHGGTASSSTESSAIHQLNKARDIREHERRLFEDQIADLKEYIAANDQSKEISELRAQLDEERDNHEDEITRLRVAQSQQVAELQEDLAKAMEAHQEEIAKLHSDDSKELTHLKSQPARESEPLKREIAQLSADLESSRANEAKLNARIDQLNSELDAAKALNDELSKHMDELKSDTKASNARSDKLSEQLTIVESELANATAKHDEEQKQTAKLRESLKAIRDRLAYLHEESREAHNDPLIERAIGEAGRVKTLSFIEKLIVSLGDDLVGWPLSKTRPMVTTIPILRPESLTKSSGASRIPRRTPEKGKGFGDLNSGTESASSSGSSSFIEEPESVESKSSGNSSEVKSGRQAEIIPTKYKEGTGYPDTMSQAEFDHEVAILDREVAKLRLSRNTGESEEELLERIRGLQRRAEELSGYNSSNVAVNEILAEAAMVLRALAGKSPTKEEEKLPGEIIELLDSAVGILEDFKDTVAAADEDEVKKENAVGKAAFLLEGLFREAREITPPGPGHSEIYGVGASMRRWVDRPVSDTRTFDHLQALVGRHEKDLERLLGWHKSEFPLDTKKVASVLRKFRALQEEAKLTQNDAEKYHYYKEKWESKPLSREQRAQIDDMATEFIEKGDWTRPQSLEILLDVIGDLLPGHSSMERQRRDIRESLDRLNQGIADLDARLAHLDNQAAEKQKHIDNDNVLRNIKKLERHRKLLLNGYKRCRDALNEFKKTTMHPLESFLETESRLANERAQTLLSDTLMEIYSALKRPGIPPPSPPSQADLPRRGGGMKDAASQTPASPAKLDAIVQANLSSGRARDATSQTPAPPRKRDAKSQANLPSRLGRDATSQTVQSGRRDATIQADITPPIIGRAHTASQTVNTEPPAPIPSPHLEGACFCTLLVYLFPDIYENIVHGGCCSNGAMSHPTRSGPRAGTQPPHSDPSTTTDAARATICRGHHGHGLLLASGDLYTIICNILTALIWFAGLILYSPFDFVLVGLGLAAAPFTPLTFIFRYSAYLLRYAYYKLGQEGGEISSWDLNHPRAHPTKRGPNGRPLYAPPARPRWPGFGFAEVPSAGRIASFFITLWTVYVTLVYLATLYERQIWTGANDYYGYGTAGYAKDLLMDAALGVVPYADWSLYRTDFVFFGSRVRGLVHGLFYDTRGSEFPVRGYGYDGEDSSWLGRLWGWER